MTTGPLQSLASIPSITRSATAAVEKTVTPTAPLPLVDLERSTFEGPRASLVDLGAPSNVKVDTMKNAPKPVPTNLVQETEAKANLVAQELEARADAAMQAQIPAKGVGNPKGDYGPVTPVYTMKPGESDPKKLDKTIDQFKPGVNPRYLPRDGSTFCNVFVTDVCLATGAATPTPPYSLRANQHVDWLGSADAKKKGWKEVSAEEAQKQANSGKTVVAGWKNPTAGESGHMAIVRPGTCDPVNGPTIANVGGDPGTATIPATPNNFEKGPLTKGFSASSGAKPSEVKYFVYEAPEKKAA